jgi:hypothetical protein
MASSAALTASAALKARVRRPSMLNKLAHAEDLIQHFPNGAYVGWSGFTGVGYPKYVSIALRHNGPLVPSISLLTLSQEDPYDVGRSC